MSATLHHIAGLVLNRPLMLLPSKLETVAAVLGGRIGVDASGLTPEASRFVGSYVDRDGTGSQGTLPYRRTADGTAVIPVIGSTVNRGAWIGASSGLVSYEGVKFQLAHAAEDSRTRAVLLDFECPGGEAVGAFEAAAVVRQVAAKKPVVAVVNGLCASAAYAMASGATRIITTPSGISGSIGVVMLHTDVSGALAKAGVKPTLIYAGAHKVDGNPYGPLPDSVAASLKAEIEAFYGAFIDCVAAGRKNLSAAAIRGTEASTFIGAAAVAAGLADAVGTFESALADLSAGRISATTAQGTPTVTHTARQPGASGPAPAGSIDWDTVVAEQNARLDLTPGVSPKAVYGQRRAIIEGRSGPPIGNGWDETIEKQNAALRASRGVSPDAVYASRREQAATAQASGGAASETINWDEVVDRVNADAGLRRGPNAAGVYAARRAQTGGDR
ncbi:S49 family peptidase [Methylobacterium sp. NEAU 140]|uniref:S49 family peptidase n=1 Tax=Methylobacterium sp. NEAU 140 TaxID=3064945 RepID=UPI00273418C5|nr:S49 family peptidase [Methylobacterium sp. NEAU 140]MDP4022425.1 S49 family peptidase [Methylobacterium sp. NEAU 140]